MSTSELANIEGQICTIACSTRETVAIVRAIHALSENIPEARLIHDLAEVAFRLSDDVSGDLNILEESLTAWVKANKVEQEYQAKLFKVFQDKAVQRASSRI